MFKLTVPVLSLCLRVHETSMLGITVKPSCAVSFWIISLLWVHLVLLYQTTCPWISELTPGLTTSLLRTIYSPRLCKPYPYFPFSILKTTSCYQPDAVEPDSQRISTSLNFVNKETFSLCPVVNSACVLKVYPRTWHPGLLSFWGNVNKEPPIRGQEATCGSSDSDFRLPALTSSIVALAVWQVALLCGDTPPRSQVFSSHSVSPISLPIDSD